MPHTQIFNKNLQLILSIKDLFLRFTVNLDHMQIFNKNQQFIWSLIDLLSRSMSDFPHTQIPNINLWVIYSLIAFQESVNDLVTYTSPIKICSQLVHIQILNKNLQLS